MSVPTNPTPTSIVTEGLKRAGRTTPSTTQILDALANQLQEVKADIMLAAPTHSNLMSTNTTVTTRGLQRYAIPDNANELASINLLDGPDEWRGTAQGSATFTITLASSLQATDAELAGKYIIITGGTGIESYRQILSYVPATHVATVDLDWVSFPTATSTYLIAQRTLQLWPYDTRAEFDRIETVTALGVPAVASVYNQEFLLYPVPDKSTYGLVNRCWVDLGLLDEDDDLFIQLLREWRSLWIQGVAVKSMQRYDEDRYQGELSVYKTMLDLLSSQTCQVSQVRAFDVA